MKKITIFLLFQYFISGSSFSQITISPEIGISHSPFDVYGINVKESYNRLDYLVGVSSQMPINKDWYLNLRFLYTIRKPAKYMDHVFSPYYQFSELHHNDLVINFLGNRNFLKKLSFGTGPSLIYSINSHVEIHDVNEENIQIDRSQFILGTALNSTLRFNFFNINLSYTFIIYEENLEKLAINRKDNNNRFDLTLSISIYSGKKK